MDPVEYLRGLERRWKLIAACVLVALPVGWVVTAGGSVSVPPSATFRATTYLLGSSTTSIIGKGLSNLQTVATLATLGEVPRRAAEALQYEGDPSELARNIQVVPDEATGFLSVTATAPTAPRAKLLADTYAEELLRFLRERTLRLVRSLQEQLERLDQQIAELDRELVQGDEDKPVLEERDTLDLQRQFLAQQYSQLAASTGGSPSGFEIVEPAVATRVSTDPGLQAPRSGGMRLLLAGVIGLIVGIVIALLLERFDTRIQNKEQAEEVFKVPILAEIPAIPRGRRGSVVAAAFPGAPASHAFRLLAAALQFGRHEGLVRTESGNGHCAARTILVTSAVSSEGKSSTVANLAVMFAEVGKRVIVLCCDFRHPTLHLTFGVQQVGGLTDALYGEGAVELEWLLQETPLELVRVLSTGSVTQETGGLFGSARMRDVLSAAQAAADIVLIDTGPVLAASDWAQLIPEVEAVLLVARVGKTDAVSAERTAEILATLQAPVVGVVLNGLPRSSIRRAGFRYRFGSGGYHPPGRATTVLESVTEDAAVPAVGAAGDGGDSEGGRDRSATPDGGIPYLVRPSTEE